MSFLVAIFSILSHLFACSSFLIPSQAIMAKSYDWTIADGHVMTNARGLKKTSLSIRSSDRVTSWTSRYGSITFNQYGRDFPNGGMNEMGLAVEILWLNQSVYPPVDQRPSLNELQWIQFQLDNYASIKDVVANLEKHRIAKVYANVHYFLCDANLDCLTVEFINGKAITHWGQSLPYPTITNNTYADSKSFIRGFQGFGGSKAIPTSYGSLDRFVRATYLASQIRFAENNKAGFDILDSLESVGYTKWQILYDLRNKRIQFRTKFSNRNVATIDFNDFSYGCSDTMKYIDLWSRERTNLKWTPISQRANYDLVESSLEQLYGSRLPRDLLNAVAFHPFKYSCK